MTLVGKIFTVLILVMSIVFMSFALMVFATHKNWKQAALDPNSGLKAQLEATLAQVRLLQTELEQQRAQLAEHQAARRAVLAGLESKVAAATADLTRAQQELTKLQSDHTQLVDALAVAEKNLEKNINENTALRDNLVTVTSDRNDKLTRVVQLADMVNQAQARLTQLEERRQELIDTVALYKTAIETHNIDVYEPVTRTPPVVDGLVVSVSDKNLVEVSIGRDDGLREGHSLEVYRGNRYLGKVEVVRVTANRAVARIIPELQQAPIRKGDRVATKIS